MKLYDGKRTPNGRRARIFIREKGLDLPEIVDVDIAKKEHLDPAYAALNPRRPATSPTPPRSDKSEQIHSSL